MPSFTLADALQLPSLRRSGPTIVAAESHLDRTIRWAHATELYDVAPLLRPGDLVLTMGTGLPADDDAGGFHEFAQALADAESSGLVVELGRRWTQAVPEALIEACEAHAVPLVLLRHETRFAALTQAVGEQIVDVQLAELLKAQRVHDTFTELSFDQAGPAEILDAVSRLAGGPVVLENAQNRPLDFLAGTAATTGFLDNWQARSSRVRVSGRTAWDESNGWLVTRLGGRDQQWGRLVISSPRPASQSLIAVAERAAAALALHRLHDRDRDNVLRRTHHDALVALQTRPDADDTLGRCDLLAFPTRKRRLVALLLRPVLNSTNTDTNDLIGTVVRAAHAARLPVLASEVDRDVHVLLSVSRTADIDAVTERLAGRIHEAHPVLIAAGRPAETRSAVKRAMVEARQVADAVPVSPTGEHDSITGVRRLEDLHLRGLLALFGDDDRINLYVDRELQQLKDHDAAFTGRINLMSVLRALLDHPSSKTEAAVSLHLSRAAFYDRLSRIERLLGVDLDDPDVRVSLHVALIADEVSAKILT